MENQNVNMIKGLGIAGFVLSIIAFIFSFVPCLGMYAVIPGFIALVLSSIALYQANQAKVSKGLIIAGFVVSILATAIGGWQYFVFSKAKDSIKNEIIDEFQDAMDEDFNLEDELEKAMNESLDSMDVTMELMEQSLDSIEVEE